MPRAAEALAGDFAAYWWPRSRDCDFPIRTREYEDARVCLVAIDRPADFEGLIAALFERGVLQPPPLGDDDEDDDEQDLDELLGDDFYDPFDDDEDDELEPGEEGWQP
jgi:hypothetical protein